MISWFEILPRIERDIGKISLKSFPRKILIFNWSVCLSVCLSVCGHIFNIESDDIPFLAFAETVWDFILIYLEEKNAIISLGCTITKIDPSIDPRLNECRPPFRNNQIKEFKQWGRIYPSNPTVDAEDRSDRLHNDLKGFLKSHFWERTFSKNLIN